MLNMEKFIGNLNSVPVTDESHVENAALFRKIMEWDDCSKADTVSLSQYAELVQHVDELSENLNRHYNDALHIEQLLTRAKRIPRKRLL